MADLVERTGETVFLGILTPDFEMLQLDKVVSPQVIRYDTEPGQKRPAHCTALGKLLLADLSPDQLDYYARTKPLRRFTRRTITTWAGLVAELERIRRTGVSVNVDERVPEASAVGAAIRTASGRALAGLIVAGPTSRIVARREELAQQVADAVARISKALAQDSGVGSWVDAGTRGATSGDRVGSGRRSGARPRTNRRPRRRSTTGGGVPARRRA